MSILLVALQTISVFVRHNYRVCLSLEICLEAHKCTISRSLRSIRRHYHNLIVYINRVQSYYSPGKELISYNRAYGCLHENYVQHDVVMHTVICVYRLWTSELNYIYCAYLVSACERVYMRAYMVICSPLRWIVQMLFEQCSYTAMKRHGRQTSKIIICEKGICLENSLIFVGNQSMFVPKIGQPIQLTNTVLCCSYKRTHTQRTKVLLFFLGVVLKPVWT